MAALGEFLGAVGRWQAGYWRSLSWPLRLYWLATMAALAAVVILAVFYGG